MEENISVMDAKRKVEDAFPGLIVAVHCIWYADWAKQCWDIYLSKPGEKACPKCHHKNERVPVAGTMVKSTFKEAFDEIKRNMAARAEAEAEEV